MYAIETKDLCKSYKSLMAVNKLNLTVNEGELFSLLGVNGAGKTTTIKILCGLTKESDGEAFICEKSIDTQRDDIKKLINVSPQETAVAPNLSVRENLELIAGIYGYKGDSLVKRVEQVAKQFSLDEVMSQRAKTLSGGWQRRLSIAMAIISEPKVLFLDEPTLGLDVLARRELWRVIKGLKGSVTIVLTTHYMEEAQELSDRIGVMAKGKLLTVDTPKNLMEKTSSQNIEEAFVKIAEGEVK